MKSDWQPKCLFSVGVIFDIPHDLPIEQAYSEIKRALTVLLPKITADAVVKKCKNKVSGCQIDIYQRPISDIYGEDWSEDITFATNEDSDAR